MLDRYAESISSGSTFRFYCSRRAFSRLSPEKQLVHTFWDEHKFWVLLDCFRVEVTSYGSIAGVVD